MPKLTILIVDDDATVNRLLSKVLNAEGYETLSVSSGEEALDMVKQKTIDLAFVDLRLAGMDGITAIKKMKELNAGLSFVMITGFGDTATVKVAAQIGVFDYITKPFDLDYIRHLTRHLEHNRLRILPYSEYMEGLFKGELTAKELTQKKFTSFKEEIEDRMKNLNKMRNYVDKEISRHYRSPSVGEFLGDNLKRLVTNFYFIVIVSGIVIGILFGYFYAQFSSKNIYKELTGEKGVTISDFYKSLNEMKYWMQKHTEQGIVLDKDTQYRSGE